MNKSSQEKANKQKRRFSLRYKWVLFICTAILLSLSSTVIFTQVTIGDILKDDNQMTTKNNAKNTSKQINLELNNYVKSIEQLAGVVTTQLDREEPISNIESTIKAVLEKNKLLKSAYYMDFQTGDLHSSPSMDFSGDVRETRTYTSLEKNTETQWMDVYEDIINGTIMTSVVTPVILHGEMIGALGYDIDLSTIGDTRKSLESDSGNKLSILDPNGVIVTSFMKDADGKNMKPSNSGDGEGVEDLVSNKKQFKSEFGWVEKVYNDQSLPEEFTWEGETYFLYSTTIPDLNWKVISYNPKEIFVGKMNDIKLTSVISIVIGLVIGIICASFLARKLTKIITNLRRTLAKTAKGDLTTEFIVSSNDEIGDLSKSYNEMLRNIRGLITKVNENVGSVDQATSGLNVITNENSSAIAEVSRSAEEIATGAANQSEELEQGSSAIYDLGQGIEELIKQSNTIEEVVDEAAVQLENGTQQTGKLDTSYHKLDSSFQKVTAMISSLDESSKSISQVTTTISQIADQTNLLSLNASIEAARAGEHGKGFAVVANEVRGLAEDSQEATKNIQLIINTVLGTTKELVDVMEVTNQISFEQKDAVSKVSISITELAMSLNKMLHAIREEAKSINSIQDQKESVVKMIEEITAVSQQTTASSEEIASTMEEQSASSKEVAHYTEQLASMIKDLEKTIGEFDVGK